MAVIGALAEGNTTKAYDLFSPEAKQTHSQEALAAAWSDTVSEKGPYAGDLFFKTEPAEPAASTMDNAVRFEIMCEFESGAQAFRMDISEDGKVLTFEKTSFGE